MVGGGDHADSAGGYSAGNGELYITEGVNGLGATKTSGTIYSTAGGGYYSKPYQTVYLGISDIYFNQGGAWGSSAWLYDRAGSGGNAGAGGTVYYSDLTKIHAYNGDRITNEDYTTTYYEYEADGTLTTTIASPITKLDGTTVIPAKIFAQEGIIRATYETNQHMTEEEAKFWNVEYIGNSKLAINVQITEETTTVTTDYGQGIGSGAGNLEKSNGILKPISEYSE